MGSEDTGASDMPFDDEPFDAGVEANEEDDPKKFIQQLTGKLGQSLRNYTEEQGQPDLELEKFAINSLLSATHTSQMDSEDQKDIIKKVKTSGEGGEESTDTGEETAPDGEEENLDTSGEAAPEGEEVADETSNDEDNLFEIDAVNEMSLNDWKVKLLIRMYDEGNDSTKRILTRLISFEEMIKDAEKNKYRFLKDLEEDHDNNDIIEILNDLKNMGVAIPKYFNDSNVNESFFLMNPKKNNMFQEGSNDILNEKGDRCTRIAKRKYDVWPSAYASGAVVKCRQGKIWKNISEEELDKLDMLEEKWSKKYKGSIDCNNPKGFSQKAFCQGKKK